MCFNAHGGAGLEPVSPTSAPAPTADARSTAVSRQISNHHFARSRRRISLDRESVVESKRIYLSHWRPAAQTDPARHRDREGQLLIRHILAPQAFWQGQR